MYIFVDLAFLHYKKKIMGSCFFFAVVQRHEHGEHFDGRCPVMIFWVS